MFYSYRRLAQPLPGFNLSYKAYIKYLSGIHLLSVNLHFFSNTVNFLPLDRHKEETGRVCLCMYRGRREKEYKTLTIMPSFT